MVRFLSPYIWSVKQKQPNAMNATHILTDADNTVLFNQATMQWEAMTYPTHDHLCDGGIMLRIAAEVNAQVNCVELGGGIRVVNFNA